jgi:hypothetical protein
MYKWEMKAKDVGKMEKGREKWNRKFSSDRRYVTCDGQRYETEIRGADIE